MPAADIVLADDIVQSLAGRAWTVPFLAERMWVPEWDERRELTQLRVGVQPGLTPSGTTRADRGAFEETWPIDLHFAARLQTRRIEEIDSLADVVEEVRKHLVSVAFDAAGMEFQPTGYEYFVRFDPRQLCRELRGSEVIYTGDFISILQVQYLRIA